MGKSRKTQIRKTSSGCAVKLKPGSVLCDTAKEKWLLGKPIGAGGFGDIYLVSKDLSRSVPADAHHVAKVELLSNGPLFVEMNFYLRVGKEDKIDKWKSCHKLEHLGMPHYIAFGSHSANNDRYRFLILQRYGPDIGSLFTKHGRRFPLKTVLTIGLQVLDILEFIHYHGYIHADVKGSNLLLGLGKKGQNKVYLLDYGLACLYVDRFGCHKEFVQDMRKAHDGTMEYTSRDAHVGAHSRRGDLEVLGYNLVQWLCGELPWEAHLSDPDRVAAAKNLYMSNISHFMEKCFPRGGAPAVIVKFLRYVAGLSFTDKPDYGKLRTMLRQGLRAAGLTDDGILNLEDSLVPATSKRQNKNRGRGSDTENRPRSRQAPRTFTRSTRKPCAPVEGCERRTRLRMADRTAEANEKFDWVKVLQSHPERDAKPAKQEARKTKRAVRRTIEDVDPTMLQTPENVLANPTPAIEEILRLRRRQRVNFPVQAARRGRVDSHRYSPPPCESSALTPAMEEVLRRRIQNGTGNHGCTKTAMSTRAERMRLRDHHSHSQETDDSPTHADTYTSESPTCRSPPSLRTRKRAQTQKCAQFTSTPPARLLRPTPRRAAVTLTPDEIADCYSRVTRTRKRPAPTYAPEDSLEEDMSESEDEKETLHSSSSSSAFQPVSPRAPRVTRQQQQQRQRCAPTLWSAMKALEWRPPTPPRKPSSRPLLHPVKKRRMSDDSVLFGTSSLAAGRVTRLNKSMSMLPVKPKHSPKKFSGAVKRTNRREVSPSEVDFVPRLRSGKDPLIDFRAVDRHSRSATSPPIVVRSFTANLAYSLRKGVRSFMNFQDYL